MIVIAFALCLLNAWIIDISYKYKDKWSLLISCVIFILSTAFFVVVLRDTL